MPPKPFANSSGMPNSSFHQLSVERAAGCAEGAATQGSGGKRARESRAASAGRERNCNQSANQGTPKYSPPGALARGQLVALIRPSACLYGPDRPRRRRRRSTTHSRSISRSLLRTSEARKHSRLESHDNQLRHSSPPSLPCVLDLRLRFLLLQPRRRFLQLPGEQVFELLLRLLVVIADAFHARIEGGLDLTLGLFGLCSARPSLWLRSRSWFASALSFA